MKDGSLKVVVTINEAIPMLVREFSHLVPSMRSERLRSLCMVGMHVEAGAAITTGVSTSVKGVTGSPENIESAMRFAVVLNEAHPKLHAHIRNTPERMRAERLRSLALLGLYAEMGKLAVGAPQDTVIDSSHTHALDVAEPISSNKQPAGIVDRQKNVALKPKSSPESTKPESVGAQPAPPSSVETKQSEAGRTNAVSKGVRSFARSLG